MIKCERRCDFKYFVYGQGFCRSYYRYLRIQTLEANWRLGKTIAFLDAHHWSDFLLTWPTWCLRSTPLWCAGLPKLTIRMIRRCSSLDEDANSGCETYWISEPQIQTVYRNLLSIVGLSSVYKAKTYQLRLSEYHCITLFIIQYLQQKQSCASHVKIKLPTVRNLDMYKY